MSGIHVTYNLSAQALLRIQNVEVLCTDCLVPRYELLDDEKIYKIITSSYLSFGGDGYTIFTVS